MLLRGSQYSLIIPYTTTYKPLCFYVMHDGSVNKDKAIFERPDMSMQQHLKHLYIRAKIDSVGVNKVLIYC